MARRLKNTVNVAELLRPFVEEVDNIVHNSRFEKESEIIANKILSDLTRNNPRYNDYSGNLTRSYFAFFKLNGEQYLYLTREDVSEQPTIQNRGAIRMTDNERKGQIGKNSIREGRRIYYEIKKRRHARTKNGRYVRTTRENRGMPRETEERKAHRYIERIPKPYASLIKSRLGSYSGIAVGNYTPYRRFVEARGYRVIGGGYRNAWINLARRLIHKNIEINIKQLAYKFNRGQIPMPKTAEGYALYDQPLQRSGYMSPRRNAGVGGGYGYWKKNKETGKSHWITKDIYPRG